ncbi:ferredoxin [Streptomyces sp. NPDC051572]|uniref:ferredoxin n=1 Tax=unclassified Streptomyces TaxID=2593676 RepID=UPI00344CAE19
MNITVDSARCTGHARCSAVAPEVYELDDDGYCDGAALKPDPALAEAARKGAANCPERAITISD